MVYTEDASGFCDCSMFKGQPRPRSEKRLVAWTHWDRERER